MAASTPVAFNTRAAQRKRKTPAFDGGLTDISNLLHTAGGEEERLRRLSKGSGKSIGSLAGSDVSMESSEESKQEKQPRKESVGKGADGGVLNPFTQSPPPPLRAGRTPRPSLEGEEAAVIVLQAEQLEPLDDLAKAQASVQRNWASEDWLERYETTTLVRRLVRFHAKATDGGPGFVYSNLDPVLLLLKTGVESLRSAISRNALFAIGELFDHLPQVPDPEELLARADHAVLESLVDAVVIKSANEKRFIAVAGEEVVAKMVNAVPIVSVLCAMMRHADSKSPKVCSVVARYAQKCLSGILQRPSSSRFAAMIRENKDNQTMRIVVGFTLLEQSRSVQAKKPAQEGLCELEKAVAPNVWQELLQALTPAQKTLVESIVQRPAHKSAGPKKPSIKEMMAAKRREMMAAKAAAGGKDVTVTVLTTPPPSPGDL